MLSETAANPIADVPYDSELTHAAPTASGSAEPPNGSAGRHSMRNPVTDETGRSTHVETPAAVMSEVPSAVSSATPASPRTMNRPSNAVSAPFHSASTNPGALPRPFLVSSSSTRRMPSSSQSAAQSRATKSGSSTGWCTTTSRPGITAASQPPGAVSSAVSTFVILRSSGRGM
ncbi:hypothetical protein [Humibacter ginsenosidimutans]|nr:hypothetical protein [Humibacter ginsenosidimutans]